MEISRASFYCLGLSCCIKCGGARQVTFINTEVTVKSSGRKLPWRNLPSLGFYLDSTDRLWMWPWYLGLGERYAWSIVWGLIFMGRLIVKMGQSTLSLFPLFGLMLNGPKIRLTTLNYPSHYIYKCVCVAIRWVLNFQGKKSQYFLVGVVRKNALN